MSPTRILLRHLSFEQQAKVEPGDGECFAGSCRRGLDHITAVKRAFAESRSWKGSPAGKGASIVTPPSLSGTGKGRHTWSATDSASPLPSRSHTGSRFEAEIKIRVVLFTGSEAEIVAVPSLERPLCGFARFWFSGNEAFRIGKGSSWEKRQRRAHPRLKKIREIAQFAGGVGERFRPHGLVLCRKAALSADSPAGQRRSAKGARSRRRDSRPARGRKTPGQALRRSTRRCSPKG